MTDQPSLLAPRPKRRRLRIALVVVLVLVALYDAYRYTFAELDKWYAQPPADMREVVTGNAAFATDLYAKLKNEKGNLFFSPYSISTALAMTFAALRTELNAAQKKGKAQISVANSLWPQKGYPFLPEYVGLLKQYYGTSATPLDYAGATEAARKTINDWVEQKTNRKITDLIKPGLLDSLTSLVLANAIYFKGNWASQFDPRWTEEWPFHVAADKDVKSQLMTHKGKYAYAETPDLQVLELPYAGDDLSMIVLLPRKMAGVGALESELTAAKLAKWTKTLRERKVVVSLPKFKLTCEFSLKQTLAAMGMTDVFSGKADFSGMDGSRSLFISAVEHKAFVDVNEEGTEAAAVTGVVVSRGMDDERVPVFRADHPFVFLIRDKRTGSILFLGRVANPAA